MHRYCAYCGRVAHRCRCADDDSKLRLFLLRANVEYVPSLRDSSYKRGVPPQIKKRERAKLRKHHRQWYADLCEQFGEQCLHCGETDSLVIDHILPIAKGGLSTLDNLQLLCAECNRLKGKLVFDCRIK